MSAYKFLFFSILVAALTLSSAQAQGSKVGFGVGISNGAMSVFDSDVSLVPFTSIFIPVAASSIRIEPEVGIARAVSDGDNIEFKVTLVQLGSGFFATRSVSEATDVYFGARAGVVLNQIKSDFGSLGSDEDDSKSDFFVGPAVGGEHFFGDHFSLGAEARLTIVFLGDFDDDDVSNRFTFTNGVFFIRWYP